MCRTRQRTWSAPAVLVLFSVLLTAALTALFVAMPELADGLDGNALFRLAA